MGKVCRATEHARLSRVYGPIGSAVELPVQASFAQLELSRFEGRLARKLCSHIFRFRFLREMCFWEITDARNAVLCRTKRVSEDGWGMSAARGLRNTLASTGIMVGSAPQRNCQFRLHLHNLNFQNLREVSHERFAFTSFTFTFWGRSRTKASLSHLPLSDFEGRLARKLHFHIFHFHFLREVSHESFAFTSYTHFLRKVSQESFVFTSSTFTFWGRSCASRLLGTAAACVILLSFAAEYCKSYCNGCCIKVAIVIC